MKGILISKNPNISVEGEELRPSLFEVYIKVAIKKDEPITRSYEI